MAQFVKVYDWTTGLGFKLEKRFVFSIIQQFTESEQGGFWGGYSVMSERLGIPKSICKKLVKELVDEDKVVIESRKTFFRKTRIFLSTDKEKVEELLSRTRTCNVTRTDG